MHGTTIQSIIVIVVARFFGRIPARLRHLRIETLELDGTDGHIAGTRETNTEFVAASTEIRARTLMKVFP